MLGLSDGLMRRDTENACIPDLGNEVSDKWHVMGLGRLWRSRFWWTVLCLQDVENEVPVGSWLKATCSRRTVWPTGVWGILSRGSSGSYIQLRSPREGLWHGERQATLFP